MNRERKIEAVATWIHEHSIGLDGEVEDLDALAKNIVNDLFPESLPKYVILNRPSGALNSHPLREYQDQINEYVEQGYRVHTLNEDTALLSLSSAKYRGITNLTDVPPEDVDEMITHGWEILETFSKKIRMVLRE